MKHELAVHLKITHADQRAYKCQLCTRAFKGKAALKRHLQTYHTNIRKVHCPGKATSFTVVCVFNE